MRLSRIFVDQALQQGAEVQLIDERCHYVRNVLRLKPGADIALFNGRDCYDYQALLAYEGKRAIATIQCRLATNTEPKLSTEIIQGLSRSDRMDWMIQKSTELGVKRISVFNAMHTQIPLKPAQIDKRLEHWRNITIKACEQSGRHIPPVVSFQPSLARLFEEPITRDLKILLSFDGLRMQSDAITRNTKDQIAILLGPEGGLSDSEIISAYNADFIATSLGPRVLRTETAAATSLAILQYHYGDI